MLFWDRDGYSNSTKRLDVARFGRIVADDGRDHVEIGSGELATLLEGIDAPVIRKRLRAALIAEGEARSLHGHHPPLLLLDSCATAVTASIDELRERLKSGLDNQRCRQQLTAQAEAVREGLTSRPYPTVGGAPSILRSRAYSIGASPRPSLPPRRSMRATNRQNAKTTTRPASASSRRSENSSPTRAITATR
jgi:hypothetical protein